MAFIPMPWDQAQWDAGIAELVALEKARGPARKRPLPANHSRCAFCGKIFESGDKIYEQHKGFTHARKERDRICQQCYQELHEIPEDQVLYQLVQRPRVSEPSKRGRN